MKAIRYALAKAHQNWTAENWRKVLFSDESTVQRFASRKQLMQRPVGTRYEDNYTIQTMKHPPSIMSGEQCLPVVLRVCIFSSQVPP